MDKNTRYSSKAIVEEKLAHGSDIYEPKPIQNDLPPVWNLVMEDMHVREATQVREYLDMAGCPTDTDLLENAYRLALAQLICLRQLICKRENGNDPPIRIEFVTSRPLCFNPGGASVVELVISDMYKRDQMGREKHGGPLQPFNGRDGLWDAYQEALDQAVYLRQLIYERDNPNERVS